MRHRAINIINITDRVAGVAALGALCALIILLAAPASLQPAGRLAWAADAGAGAQAAAAPRMRKELRRLHVLRRSHRKELFALPGVIGVATEKREHPDRAVLAIYVTKDTPELRAEIASRLPGEPVEIVEKPGGFRAY